jgi:uncharacterized phage protein gp47/JayE
MIKNYDEIYDNIVEILTSHFGPIDSEADSTFGQVSNPFALQHTDVYQQLDNLIQGLSPSISEGEAQNRIFAFLNLIRQDATATTVPLVLDGTEGTIVPQGSVATSSVNGATYATDADATITKNNSVQIKYEVGAITGGDTVSIVINSNTISIVASSSDPITAATDLVLAINLTTPLVSAYNVGAMITVQSYDLKTVFSADASSNTTIYALGTPSDATGEVVGKISCPARSVNIITSPVAGWDSVDNLLAGQRGRATESDADFRQRRLRSFLMAGGATPTGMQAKILNFVDGVSFCRVYDNPTSLVDEFGRPPHSVHVVAEGGTDFDIASMIGANKSAGIATFGAVTVNLTDSEGYEVAVNFDRPAVKYAWVEVTINSKNFEETFPPNGLDIIRQNVYDFSSVSFSYGDDLILQKFYTPVYEVQGIKDVSIRLAVTDNPGDTPSFVSGNISIDPTVYTDWLNDPNRIIVVDNS